MVHPENLDVLVVEAASKFLRYGLKQFIQFQNAAELTSNSVKGLQLGGTACLDLEKLGVGNGHRRLGGEQGNYGLILF